MPSHSIVQSVLLRRSAFKNMDEAKEWLVSHGYKYVLPDVTPTYYRFRQHDPAPLALTHRLRTTQLGDPDSSSPMGSVGALIIAYPKGSHPMAKDPPASAGSPTGSPTMDELKVGDVVEAEYYSDSRRRRVALYVTKKTAKTATAVKGVIRGKSKTFAIDGDRTFVFRGKTNVSGELQSSDSVPYAITKIVGRGITIQKKTERESESESE